ncbi:PAS domain-containing sensor histidine kinase [Aureimonas pseudogalii]|uniref:Blue-light-activated histidine kinase n=1 Tax=Aureimonas pseudogalii TaxID=1744844 RepID=A0A7W6H5N3_9HYPH|nr:PAS domain S-box protein [Aureimonas pseudogalii]MBB3999022.1 PAS domain S-box-containing protein [Aureimonas pseudogalii]
MTAEFDGDRAAATLEIARLRAEIDRLRAAPDERRILDSLDGFAIVAADGDDRITLWNDAARALLGHRTQEALGQPVAFVTTPEDRLAGRPAQDWAALRAGERLSGERWCLRADGTRILVHATLLPLQGDAPDEAGLVMILRDHTGEDEARRGLAADQERLQLALDTSALVGTWDWDVRRDLVVADARFAWLYGVDAEQAAAGLPLSRYLGGVMAEDVDGLRSAIDAALGSGSLFAHDYRTVDAEGDVHWVRAQGRALPDASGCPARFLGAVVDVTRERQRERRQAALLRLGDEGRAFGEPVDYTLCALEILGETIDIDRVGYATVDSLEQFATVVGEWTRPGFEPLAGRLRIADFGSSLVAGLRRGLIAIDDVSADPATADGAAAWQHIRSRSMLNMSVVENGRVQVILYLHCSRPRSWSDEDVGFVREVLNRAWSFSRRRRTEQALREAEARLRLAHETAQIGSFDFDLNTGTLVSDERCRTAFGILADEPISFHRTLKPLFHPDDRARVLADLDRSLKGDGLVDMVTRTVGRDDGAVRFVHVTGQTVREDGRMTRLVGAVRDVTDERETEERQVLLTRELQHRVKNTLAMVNALANQTLRRAANVQDGLAAFSARLIALSHAHDILTQTSWTSAPIAAVVAQSTAPGSAADHGRIAWSGPDVRLTARQSLALALALHELTTNAVKYGALSNEEGTVRVVWRVALGNGAQRLRFEWLESGGPPVAPPLTRGFGSRLIEQSLSLELGGTVSVDYRPEGLRCLIDADLELDLDEDVVLSSRLDDVSPPRA